tara:strand:- start:1307 stop:2398 length:1092 start_codon:yes stop_codon:yes gene_type:complete
MSNPALPFNVQTHHPLIKREHFYTVDRKLVTIHSEDRDTCKWPVSNVFEVELPEVIQNVQSIRLLETAMPSNFYNVSRQFQNTALTYTYDSEEKVIELCDGFYNPVQMACTLTKLFENNIVVKYDPVLQKFIFYSDNEFSLQFDKAICYRPQCGSSSQVWCQNTKWGLGFYLGFEKATYNSVDESTTTNCTIKNCMKNLIDASGSSGITSCEGMVDYSLLKDKNILISPKFPKLEGEQVIYMELDKYNTYDEITPHPSQTNSTFSNNYTGKVNSAFAKIPLKNGPSATGSNTFFDSINDSYVNSSYHDPPIEKIKKLKFKFRYHNGELVDFQDSPFTFTVEFNSLRNDIEKNYKVRMPYIAPT